MFIVLNHEKKKRLLQASTFVIIYRITLILKKWWKEKLFLSLQSINIIYPNEDNMFVVRNHEEEEIIHASMFITIDEITLIPKNGGKKMFSYQTKASLPFIPISRMCLWCPIMKSKEIISCIHVCHN